MSRARTKHTPEEKVAILKRHLPEKVPVSDLGDELGLNPTVFYGWQKLFFENGAVAFQKTRARQADRRDQRIEKLEAKLAQKNGPKKADRHRRSPHGNSGLFDKNRDGASPLFSASPFTV